MPENNSNNTSQAAWIAIGSLCSFLFTLVSSALLSRYLTKEAYGTYKQVMYVYNTLLSVFTLGLPLAYSYYLPRVSLPIGKALTKKMNNVFIVLGFIFSISLYLSADVVSSVLRNPDLSLSIRIFSPSPILILPTMGLQGVLATYKKTMLNAIYILISRIFMLLCVVLPVCMISSTVETALWGFVLSSFISMIVAIWFMNFPYRNVNKEPTAISYKQIFSYSLPLMAAGVLGVAINAADQFYISRYFGQEVFADFSNGSLELPFVGMVLSACGTVLLPVFSRMIYENTPVIDILQLWKRTALKAAYVLYPMIVFCMFYATDIMTFLYGNQYFSSGLYFRVMLIANFFTVIQFYPVILALGKTKQYATAHIAVFFMVWVTEALAVWIVHTAISITIVSVICKIVKILLLLRVVSTAMRLKVWQLFPTMDLVRVLICCVFAGITAFGIVKLLFCIDIVFMQLSVSFILFSILTLLFGRLFKINFLSVIHPILLKYAK